MVLFIAVVFGLVIGIVTGGSFSGFSAARFRYLPIIIIATLIQVLIFTSLLGTYEIIHRIGPYIYMATILASLFFIISNLSIPGMRIVLVGALMNAIVIFANFGFMPAPESALKSAGRHDRVVDPDGGSAAVLSNSKIADDDTRLLFLGDIIAIPSSFPLANVISIGDILIAVGVAVAIVRVMHLKLKEEEPIPEQQAAERTP